MSNLTYSVSGKTRTGIIFTGDGIIRSRVPMGNITALKGEDGTVIGVEVRDITKPLPRATLDKLLTHDASTARAVDEFLRRIERVRQELRKRKG